MHYGQQPGLRFFLPTDGTFIVGGTEQYSYVDLVEAARHVAWHYSIGTPGKFHAPGDMLRTVMDAMARADMDAMARLRRGYPLHAALMEIIKNDDTDGISMILNLLDYTTRTIKPGEAE
jgi:hypothetical protein